MNEKRVYLKPNVVLEPLIERWYAWSHLVSPATLAMNVVGRHLEIINSFIMAPSIHAEAILNPKLRGGPFLDISVDRLEEVKQLESKTRERQEKQVQLAKAIKELDRLLLQEAKGFGLEGVYDKIPAILKGFVEIFYDRNNNATFRFFESLLYASEYYSDAFQSIALWITNNDQRPFCLSTPRLDQPHALDLQLPFNHFAIDNLARMKRTAGSLEKIKEELGITKDQEPLFETLFTEEAPPSYNRYTGDKIRMRYFGHACILVETKDVSILLDPLISYYGYSSDLEHFSDADLPDVIDYALITHNHQDHIIFETLLPLRHKIKKLVVPKSREGRLEDPSLKLMFEQIGFSNVVEIEDLETVRFADATITGLPFMGEHCDLNIQAKACYLVRIGSFKLLFMADSRVSEPMLYKRVFGLVGKVDVLFLGMECDGAPLSWLYGPLMPKKLPRDQDGSRRLAGSDCVRGMALVDTFQPREVYVYAMGQEPWVEFISSIKYTDDSNPIVQSNKLVSICRSRGIVAERLYGEKELLYEKELVVEYQ
jgi:L-ascorbate metabolism protein UlaG (beta-lactamase superfamily)